MVKRERRRVAAVWRFSLFPFSLERHRRDSFPIQRRIEK
jgi:hypothetical protein